MMSVKKTSTMLFLYIFFLIPLSSWAMDAENESITNEQCCSTKKTNHGQDTYHRNRSHSDPTEKKIEIEEVVVRERSNSEDKKKRGRKPIDREKLFCFHCGKKQTPEWRRGPCGKHTLCNACGLSYSNKVKLRKSCGNTMKINYVLNENNLSPTCKKNKHKNPEK